MAGSGVTGSTDGTGTAAAFMNPSGVAVTPSGSIYVTDYYVSGNGNVGYSLRRVTSWGEVTTLMLPSTLTAPRRIAWGSSGDLFMTESSHHRISRLSTG